MTDWFLKKSTTGEVFGPASLSELKTWSAAGRVGPGDSVSPDGSDWQPAIELPDLELHYLIVLGNNSQFGPIHFNELKELVKESELSPKCVVLHVPSGVQQSAAAWLDGQDISHSERPVTNGKEEPVHAPVQSEHDLPETMGSGPSNVSAPSPNESTTDWKTLYESELKTRLSIEHELSEQLDELRDQLRAAQIGHRAETDQSATGSAVDIESAPLFRQLKQDLTAKNTKLEALKQQLRKHEDTLGKTDTRAEELAEREQSLKQQLSELEDEWRREGDRANRLAEEVEALKRQVSELNEARENRTTNQDQEDRSEPKHTDRWQQLYERERVDHQDAQRTYKQSNQELRDQLAQALAERNRAQQKAQKLEKRLEEAKAELSPSDSVQKIASLQDAYEQLKENHDSLLHQLQAKNTEIERLRAQSTKKSDVSGQRLSEMQSELDLGKNRSQDVLRQLAEMEERHIELLKSYRDLNDRYVRLKHADYR